MISWKQHETRSCVLILILLGLGVLAAAGPPPALAAETSPRWGAQELCAAAVAATPGAVVRTADGEKELLVRLELRAPGILTLDGAARGLRAAPCDADPAEAILLEESAGHLAFAVRGPGAWLVRAVAAELVTGFVATREEEQFTPHGVWTLFRRAGFSTKEEDHEVDPDPKTTESGARRYSARVTFPAAFSTKEEDHEVDPDPKTLGMASPVRLIRFETAAGVTESEVRDALAEWLTGWLETTGPSAGDERLRLLALTSR